jgi:hypothetical protein
MNYQQLKAQKDGKRLEQRLIEGQILTLMQEIQLREKQSCDLQLKWKQLNDEAQGIADKMLELEYQILKANNQ